MGRQCVLELRRFLEGVAAGVVEGAVVDELIDLLARAWDDLDGARSEKMEAYKLQRMEKVEWEPPVLSFVIERHGGTVLGSTRADLQRWEINPDAGTACWAKAGFRQIEPLAPRINLKKLSREVFELIENGVDDERLKWDADRARVRVRIGKVIPAEGFGRTTSSRRKRFRGYLGELLKGIGWEEAIGSAANTYRKVGEDTGEVIL